MRTDADDPARVRDPTLELLLTHTATLTKTAALSLVMRECEPKLRRRHQRPAGCEEPLPADRR
jgi:hypothetical protein